MKTHDITGHRAGQALRGIAVCAAALCLMAACSREEALSDPAAAGMYDGPLTIRADIGGMLETRATHSEGPLKNDEMWVLSTKWKGLDSTEYSGINYTEYFKANFSKGYGEFEWRRDSIIEIKWSDLITEYGYYTIGLDNGPIGWADSGYPVNSCSVSGKGRFVNFAGFSKEVSDSLLARYKAQVEPEDGTMAQNDLIAGRYYESETNSNNKRWIDIPLRHLMSRVHVEITAPAIQNIETKDVQVWLSPLAEKCYGIERILGADSPGVLIDSIKFESGNWVLALEKSGDKVFTSDLYLLGSADKSEPLLRVPDKEGTFRTHYLIMPPQTTHLSAGENNSLRPTLYLKIGDRTWAGMLPGNITIGGEPQTFSEFGSGQNITLKVEITDAPPAINIEATVRQWEDKGTWLLGTDRGGIRSAEDFKNAVSEFKKYAEGDPTWEPGTTKPEPLERYGNLDGKSKKFTFHFFNDFEETTEDLPSECKIPDTDKYNHFDVNLHGHTVYGVDGLQGGKDNSEALKGKMLSD